MKPSDRYIVEETLGQGGFGIVFAARDRESGQRVALKVLSSAIDDGERERFDALSRLAHPHLVQLLDGFFDEEPPFFTMALARGPSFLDYVRGAPPAASEPSGPARSLPLAFGQPVQDLGDSVFSALGGGGATRLRRALGGLAAGLHALHGAGFVHRDLCPDNVRVVRGSTMLLDYGLSARPGEPPQSGAVGRIAYMAPEQWESGRLTPAADWYSVGLLLFEALTGALPFSGTAQEVLLRKRTVGAPPPSLLVSGVPEDLDELCAELLRGSPELRPDGATVLRALTEH